MNRTRALTLALVVTIGATMAWTGALAVSTESVDARPASTGHDSPANYSVQPAQAPADRKPGVSDASYKQWAQSNVNIESIDYLVLMWAAGDLSNCSTENVEEFGIDRGANRSGTQTDEGLLQYVEDTKRSKDKLVVDFYDENDVGESTYFNTTDEFVSFQKNCFGNPSEPGWYQLTAKMNGTGWNGEPVSATVDSHYFWICDCGSEQEARNRLGPPPSEQGGNGNQSTQTATPTPGASPRTDSPTSDESPRESTPTSPTAGTSQQQPTTSPTGGTSPAGQSPSPTSGDGPGFGHLVAVIGLVASALLAVFRANR